MVSRKEKVPIPQNGNGGMLTILLRDHADGPASTGMRETGKRARKRQVRIPVKDLLELVTASRKERHHIHLSGNGDMLMTQPLEPAGGRALMGIRGMEIPAKLIQPKLPVKDPLAAVQES